MVPDGRPLRRPIFPAAARQSYCPQ